jgi:hypothetical protein
MQEDPQEDYFTSSGRRKRTVWIVIAHLLVVGAFFGATFYWGNFT